MCPGSFLSSGETCLISQWCLYFHRGAEVRQSGGKVEIVHLFRSCALPKLEGASVYPYPEWVW